MVKISTHLPDDLPGLARPRKEAQDSVNRSFLQNKFIDDLNENNIDFDKPTDQYNLGDEKRKLEEEIFDRTCSYKAVIDYNLFIEYTHECYYYKYGGVIAVTKLTAQKMRNISSELETNPNIIGKKVDKMKVCVEAIREHLSNKKTPMMTDEEIKAHLRRVQWLLEYWTNSYINDCKYPNPCQTYKGKSYYGWVRDDNNYHACRSTSDVSEEKETYSWSTPTKTSPTKLPSQPMDNLMTSKKPVRKVPLQIINTSKNNIASTSMSELMPGSKLFASFPNGIFKNQPNDTPTEPSPTKSTSSAINLPPQPTNVTNPIKSKEPKKDNLITLLLEDMEDLDNLENMASSVIIQNTTKKDLKFGSNIKTPSNNSQTTTTTHQKSSETPEPKTKTSKSRRSSKITTSKPRKNRTSSK